MVLQTMIDEYNEALALCRQNINIANVKQETLSRCAGSVLISSILWERLGELISKP